MLYLNKFFYNYCSINQNRLNSELITNNIKIIGILFTPHEKSVPLRPQNISNYAPYYKILKNGY